MKRYSRELKRNSRELERVSREQERDSRELERDSRELERDFRVLERDSCELERDSRELERDSRELERDFRELEREPFEPNCKYQAHVLSSSVECIFQKDSLGYKTVYTYVKKVRSLLSTLRDGHQCSGIAGNGKRFIYAVLVNTLCCRM